MANTNNTNLIKKACYNWLKEFTEIPREIVEKLGKFELGSIIEITSNLGDSEEENLDFLPMWGWMWQPPRMDLEWFQENVEAVAECGFRIYQQEDFELLIGIDGAGYDFYERHWIPLYRARGLRWHLP